MFIEKEIIDEKMNQKYFNLVRKGFQPSSLDLKDHINETGKSTDFAYISKAFSEVSDDEITFTESDLKQYSILHLRPCPLQDQGTPGQGVSKHPGPDYLP